MSGIGSIYYVGNAGGFLGSDGLNGTYFKIDLWHADRMTLVVTYNTYDYRPMYMSLKGFVPNGPYDKDMLRRAMILFASNLFDECPSFNKVKLECEGVDYIDFSADINVSKHFNDLLEESRNIDISDKVHIFESALHEVDI